MPDLQVMSFNSGELSPLLDGRSDLEKYYSGSRLLENMIPLPYGPATRRPGTYFVSEIKDNSKKARLISFQYSTEQAYILEFGDQYIRFYKDKGQIVYTDITFTADPSGDFAVGATMTGGTSGATAIIVAKISTRVYTIKYLQGTFEDETISCGAETVVCGTAPSTATSDTTAEISSDYLEADLPTLQKVQSADVLFNVHSDYPPSKLMRYSHDYWKLENIVFDWPPFLAENDTETAITPTLPSDITSPGGQTITADDETPTHLAAEAFDNVVTGVNGWGNETVVNAWIKIDFGGGVTKTVKKIRIQPTLQTGIDNDRNVRRCKLQGSNNDADWTKLPAIKWIGKCKVYNTDEIEIDMIDNYTDWAEIEFTNAVAYRYYRLYCYDNWGDKNILGIKEIEMFEVVNAYTADSDIFTSDHVGSYWLIKHPRTADEATTPNTIRKDFTAIEQTSDSLKDVKGSGHMRTEGNWTGRIVIERSYDEGATWHTLGDAHESLAAAGQNFNVSFNEEKGNAWYRMRSLTLPAWADACKANLSVERYYHYGIIKITTVTDSTHITATVIRTVGSTDATKLWSEGAWSDERGYPVTSAFFEGRLFYAGTSHRPLTIWGSRIEDYENMEIGTLDDDSVEFVVDSSTQNMIRWLVGQEVLLIGTAGGEWRLGSADPADAITPTNPMRPRIQTTYGSKEIQALLLANAILFVDAQGRKVRGAQYIFEKGETGGYDAPDYTLLAEHITESGIAGIAYQQNPYPILWAWRNDGKMIGMVFEPGQKVWGWFPLAIDGDVESVAVEPGTPEDTIWIIVKREINGSDKRYIEYFKPHDWGDDQADCFFVDSGLTFDGGDAVTITGITKAEPGVVTAVAHGFSDGDQVKIKGVAGMKDVNNKVFTVHSPAANSFSLRNDLDTVDWDTTGYDAFIDEIDGDTEYGSNIIKNVSTADIASISIGTPIVGTGIAADSNTTITSINDDSFTISTNATKTNTAVSFTVQGTVEKVDNAFSGLDHLEGKTVSVLGDGAVHANVVVSSGSVTLTDYFNKVHIGLPYTSSLMPMKLAVPGANIRGKKKRIHQIIFSFYKTLGAKFGTTEGSEVIPFRKTTDPMGSAPPLFTDEKEQTFPGGYELKGDIFISQEQPLPLTVRSITTKLGIYS